MPDSFSYPASCFSIRLFAGGRSTGLQVLIHGISDVLGVFYGLDDGLCAAYDITAGEDAFACSLSMRIRLDEPGIRHGQATGCIDDFVLGALADRDDCAVSRIELRGIFLDDVSVCIVGMGDKNRSLVGDFLDLHPALEGHAIRSCVIRFALACTDVVAAGVNGYMAAALPDGGTGNIHGGIAGTNDRDPVTQCVDIRVDEIVDRVVGIAERLTLDAQPTWPPDTGADEDSLIAVVEQIINRQRSANRRVRTDADTGLEELRLIAFQDCFR